MYPHRIRLRGPWQCEPLARAVLSADGHLEMVPRELPPPCRIIVPFRWDEGSLAGFAGRIRFRRRFGMPRQLDPNEAVWLTFAGAENVAEVLLNAQFLGRRDRNSASFEFEVTSLLRERNELIVDVETPAGKGGPWEEVALEVRASAFLRAVRAWAESTGGAGQLHIQGEAVGTCDWPLDLYVLADGSTLVHRTIQPLPAGQAFDIVHEDRDANLGTARIRDLRVELVNGAILWYTAACPLE